MKIHSLTVCPTNACSAKCFYCFSYTDFFQHKAAATHAFKVHDQLSVEQMTQAMDQAYPLLRDPKQFEISGGGDPLVHPKIKWLVDEAHNRGFRVQVITNAFYLTGDLIRTLSRINNVRVSVNFYDEESFVTNRGVSKDWFHRVTHNIREYARRCANISAKIVVTNENYDKVQKIRDYLTSLGVTTFTLSLVASLNHDQILEPKKFLEARGNQPTSPKTKIVRCLNCAEVTEDEGFLPYPVLGADGNFYACCYFAYDSSMVIGNLVTGLEAAVKNRYNKGLCGQLVSTYKWYLEEVRALGYPVDPNVDAMTARMVEVSKTAHRLP
jgi:MoaA/NifB/PqqE/SkfB family radical SAM enzyme